MSESVFPTSLRGLQPEIVRTPYGSTVIKTSSSGKEIRNNLYAVPRYKWSLNYGYLKDFDNAGAYTNSSDYRMLRGFFESMKTNFSSFYFADPDDYIAPLPIADGATGVFALRRNLNGLMSDFTNFQYLPIITQGVGGFMENLCQFGTQFDNAAWVRNQISSVSADTIVNPFGVTNADRVTPSGTGGSLTQTGLATISSALPFERGWTFSVYLKAATTNQNVNIAIFDSLNPTGASTTCAVTTSWQRFIVSYTPNSASIAGAATIGVKIGSAPNGISTVTGALDIACGQIERQLAASPYVTNGAGATVNTYVFAKSGAIWQASYTGVFPPNTTVMTIADAGNPLFRVRFAENDLDFSDIFRNLKTAQFDLIQVNA